MTKTALQRKVTGDEIIQKPKRAPYICKTTLMNSLILGDVAELRSNSHNQGEVLDGHYHEYPQPR